VGARRPRFDHAAAPWYSWTSPPRRVADVRGSHHLPRRSSAALSAPSPAPPPVAHRLPPAQGHCPNGQVETAARRPHPWGHDGALVRSTPAPGLPCLSRPRGTSVPSTPRRHDERGRARPRFPLGRRHRRRPRPLGAPAARRRLGRPTAPGRQPGSRSSLPDVALGGSRIEGSSRGKSVRLVGARGVKPPRATFRSPCGLRSRPSPPSGSGAHDPPVVPPRRTRH